MSKEGLTGNYGLKVGYNLQQMIEKGLLADDLMQSIRIRSVAASDARMGGAAFPAMTNSGSGNQGIAATEPVTVVADFLKVDEERRVRALALSSMVAIYAHSFLPKLSAFCATVTAAMGAAAAMAWLLAEDNPVRVAGSDGLVANSADECLRNVGFLASKGMQQTDDEVLQIMLNKNQV